jgi:hypothetical protein
MKPLRAWNRSKNGSTLKGWFPGAAISGVDKFLCRRQKSTSLTGASRSPKRCWTRGKRRIQMFIAGKIGFRSLDRGTWSLDPEMALNNLAAAVALDPNLLDRFLAKFPL